MKLSLEMAGLKFRLRSPAVERKAAHSLARKFNNIVGKLAVKKLFVCFVKDKA